MAVGTKLPFPHPHMSQLLNGEVGDEQDLREARDHAVCRWDCSPPAASRLLEWVERGTLVLAFEKLAHEEERACVKE